MKKTTIALLLTLGLGTSALMAQGGPGGECGGFEGKGHRGGGQMFQMLKQLDLTADQKSQLKELKTQQRAQMRKQFKKMHKSSNSMGAEGKANMSSFMTADSFDKEAFKQQASTKMESKHQNFESKKSEMLEKRAENMKKIFDILTPEQRTKWIELTKEN